MVVVYTSLQRMSDKILSVGKFGKKTVKSDLVFSLTYLPKLSST